MFEGLKNLIFPNDEGLQDDEFWIQSLYITISRIKVVIIATVIIEIAVAISIFLYHLRVPLVENSKQYLVLYSSFVVLSLFFYMLIRGLDNTKEISIKTVIITYGYLFFVIGWNMALSFVDGDTSTYIIAIMAMGLIGVFKPAILCAMLFFMQLILFIFLPSFIPEPQMLSTYINTSVAATISFISGNIIFKNIFSNYSIHKEISSKSLELEKVNRELNKANEKLEYLSQTDGLTGIYNRRMFDQLSEEFWMECINEGNNLAVIMIDIDHFKIYNDTYGHIQGDECLRNIVTEMKRIIPGDNLLARYGGEEFAVLIKGVSSSEAEAFADKIRKGIESISVEHKNSPVHPSVTLSVGVYCGQPSKENSVENYIHRADNALFEAKESGRNKVIAVSL